MQSKIKYQSSLEFSNIVENASEAMSIKYNNDVYELKERGVKVIVLSLGEAYFDIPLLSMEELPKPQIFHYTHSRGVPELRRKISDYYKKKYGVNADSDSEIIVTPGSKAAIYFTLLSIINPGDEVIMHEPTWVSYPEQVKMCYGRPIMMPYNSNIKDYEKYITDRTKLIVINNPHNPRGEIFKHNDLKYLVDMAKANGLYILADEAYSDFVSDQQFYSLGKLDPEKSNIIICNSISKNFGISGWRLGYSIANKNLTNQMLKINQHIATCPPSILQYYIARYFDQIIQITNPQIFDVIQKRKQVAEYMDSIGISYMAGTTTFY
jgi:aminotransferase